MPDKVYQLTGIPSGVQDDSESTDLISRLAGRFNLKLDEDWSYRQKKLFILRKFLDGSIYDKLWAFHKEYDGADQYIRLVSRRPSVLYNLPKIVVRESTGMLFGEQHFPTVRCKENEELEQFLQLVTRKAKLRKKMLEAAKKGSVGSVCVMLKVLNEKFYLEILRTQTLTPFFNNLEPDKLIRLIDKKKVDGYSLKSFGYPISKDDLGKMFYFVRQWNDHEEIYYKPYLVDDEKEGYVPQKDDEKCSVHDFGFVPAVWIKNISDDENIDGECTYEHILDITIEICYQLSQLGRLFKYNSDPTLVIKNPIALEGSQLVKGSGILSLDEKGEAYYAEMNSTAPPQVMEYVKLLREYAIEACGGNRSSPEKTMGAQSGKAIKLLNTALISLVGELRLTYGDDGLMSIYQMIIDICKSGKYSIKYNMPVPSFSEDDDIVLDWPEFYPKSPEENLQEAQTLTTYTEGAIISRETAINSIADEYNILDTQNELKSVEKQQDAEYSRERELSRGARKSKSSGA